MWAWNGEVGMGKRKGAVMRQGVSRNGKVTGGFVRLSERRKRKDRGRRGFQRNLGGMN